MGRKLHLYHLGPQLIGIFDQNDQMVVDCVAGEVSDEDAHRLVACWNACVTAPTELLENKQASMVDPAFFGRILRHQRLMRDAIRKTLAENAHLADGDDCTLRHIKDALNEISRVDLVAPPLEFGA